MNYLDFLNHLKMHFQKSKRKSLESPSVILYTDYTIHIESIHTRAYLKDKVLQRFFDIPSPLYLAADHSCVYSWLD